MHTILVVDDEDAVRLSLREYMAEAGYNVLVSSDGAGAIKHLLDNDVSAIVTDFRMEPLGGDYWVRFLARFCGDIPVYVITGYLVTDLEVDYPVIAKPFEFAKLEQRIANDLKSRQ